MIWVSPEFVLASLPCTRSLIHKNANFNYQAIPNARISCALCMLFDLERCCRLDVRFGTPYRLRRRILWGSTALMTFLLPFVYRLYRLDRPFAPDSWLSIGRYLWWLNCCWVWLRWLRILVPLRGPRSSLEKWRGSHSCPIHNSKYYGVKLLLFRLPGSWGVKGLELLKLLKRVDWAEGEPRVISAWTRAASLLVTNPMRRTRKRKLIHDT